MAIALDGDWQDLTPPVKAGAVERGPVQFGILGNNGPARRTGPKYRGVLYIRRAVIEALGMKNWRVRIRIGAGANKHQICVIPDEAGPFELSEIKSPAKNAGIGIFRVRLPEVDRFPACVIPPIDRPHRIDHIGKQKVLLVDLPMSCFDEETRKGVEREHRATTS